MGTRLLSLVVLLLVAGLLVNGCGEDTPTGVTSDSDQTAAPSTALPSTVAPSALRLEVNGDCAEVIGALFKPEAPVCADHDDWLPGNMYADLEEGRPFILFYFGASNLVEIEPGTYPTVGEGKWLLVDLGSPDGTLPLPIVRVRDPYGSEVSCTFEHFSAECS